VGKGRVNAVKGRRNLVDGSSPEFVFEGSHLLIPSGLTAAAAYASLNARLPAESPRSSCCATTSCSRY
jgi:hypothetical protein